MLSGFVTALRLLSVLPVPGREADRFSDGVPWYPAAGAVIGWLVLLVMLALHAIAPQWHGLAALGAIVATVAVTRGLHLDGLADCADGFWGGYNAQRRLEIMKDSRIGAFGVIALVFVLLAKFSVYEEIGAQHQIPLVPLAFIASRFSLVPLALLFRYPRKQGTAAAVVQGATRAHLVGAILLSLIACTITLVLSAALGAFSPLTALLVWLVSTVIGLLVGLLASRRIGGVTGDVLGAAAELSELVSLALIALL